MNISPDATVFWEYGPIKVNLTILMTWLVMAFLAFTSWLITRKLRSSRQQTAIEVIVETIIGQLKETGLQTPKKYLPFIGTLFFFIATSGILGVIPGFIPPTGSLSTTAALALCVFIAVPVYAISEKGVLGYLKNYVHPSIFLLPFTILRL